MALELGEHGHGAGAGHELAAVDGAELALEVDLGAVDEGGDGGVAGGARAVGGEHGERGVAGVGDGEGEDDGAAVEVDDGVEVEAGGGRRRVVVELGDPGGRLVLGGGLGGGGSAARQGSWRGRQQAPRGARRARRTRTCDGRGSRNLRSVRVQRSGEVPGGWSRVVTREGPQAPSAPSPCPFPCPCPNNARTPTPIQRHRSGPSRAAHELPHRSRSGRSRVQAAYRARRWVVCRS